MTITSGLFNSVNGDRRYDAKWFALFFSTFIGNGVFPIPSTGLQVVEGTNIQTIVKPGKGWINGYFIVNDANYILQHDVADGVLKRIDRVVMRLNFLTRRIEVVIKKGAFASTPAAPTLQRDADAYELALADVLINNGATVITQSNITDQRLNSALCGIVHGVVDQVDTTTIFNQYQSWFGTFTKEKQIDFDAWIASLQDVLSGDVAGNLAARITSVDNALTTHTAEDASLTQKGHVQLNSSVTSTSEVLAATPKAVKTAMDRADAAFQSASDGKTAVANAVTAKGVPASPTDTFPTLATKIGQISTGKKFATGTFSASTANTITINGLDFTPKFIMVYKNTNQSPFDLEIYIGNAFHNDISHLDNPIYSSLGGFVSGSTTNMGVNKISFFSNYFTVTVSTNGPSGYRWVAFE